MSDTPRGGAPPPKRRRSRPAPTETALVKNTSNNRAKYTTPADPGVDFLERCDFGGFDGPIVLPNQLADLIAVLTPAWLVVGLIDDEADWSSPPLALAMRSAHHILIAPNLADISAAAGRLAAGGSKVVAIEWPLDVAWPAVEPRASVPLRGDGA